MWPSKIAAGNRHRAFSFDRAMKFALLVGGSSGMITGLNHITLAVSDLERSVGFYGDLLGFSVRMQGPSSAYLEAGNLWLALVEDTAARRTPLPEYTHIAFSVGEAGFSAATERLRQAAVTRWQASERADSFYFLDPDGHKLELHCGDLCRRLRERATTKAGAGQSRCTEPGDSAVVPERRGLVFGGANGLADRNVGTP